MSLQGPNRREPGSDGGVSSEQLKRFGPPAVVGLLALIFILQNLDSVDVEFLWLDFSMPLWLLLVIFAVVGAVVFWGAERRRRVRRTRRAAS
jgi:uncharacterized integral membrane protein